MDPKRRQQAEALLDEREPSTRRASESTDMYGLLTNNRKIASAYTPDDHLKIAVGKIKEAVSWVPFFPQEYKNARQKAQDTIDGRIIVERIKTYSTDFDAMFEETKRRREYTSERLDLYSSERHKYLLATDSHHAKAHALEELADELTNEAQALHGSLPHEDIENCDQLCEQVKDRLDKTERARKTCEKHLLEIRTNQRLMKVYTVLHVSMMEQHSCAATMLCVLNEKGTYIKNMLQDYAAGGNIDDLRRWRERDRELTLVRDRLIETDRHYLEIARQERRPQTLPDKELDVAYATSLRQEAKRTAALREQLGRD